MAAPFQASHASLPNWGSDGRRKDPHWCGGKMFLENPAQITKCLPDYQEIGVLVPKPGGGHSRWLDVAVTFGDDQDHPAAKGTMVLVLPSVIPWAFRNTKALQGIDQKAGEARCSLENALGPSFLSHLKIKDRVNKLCTNTWVQRG